MKKEAYIASTKLEQDLYQQLLEITGSLTRLFSDSDDLYLHYRIMENAFCKAFNAENLSRSDLSVDVAKLGVGLGLKTFLHKNGAPNEKIAEFNRASYLFREMNNREIIQKVSEMRNERILSTKALCGLSYVGYHYVTRKKHEMFIYEEPMDEICIDNLRITGEQKTSIKFFDGIHDYTFSLSKHTLFKKFDVSKANLINHFHVDVLDDPFAFLIARHETLPAPVSSESDIWFEDYIVLPLYSAQTGNVENKSGLNMWNASGRKRHENEVYIPVPSWIHREKPDFFKYATGRYPKTDSFTVILPNKKSLSMKVTQDGGKALQSDPNKDLGHWLLREVLRLAPGTLVTKELLDIIGVDSVRLSKVKEGLYFMEFLKTGSYEDYQNDMLMFDEESE